MASENTPPYLQKYIQGSKLIKKGPPARYELQLKRVNLDKKSNGESKLRRFTLGEYNPRHQNRTILLVGATGSGKSTLINTLVNFVMGVQFENKVWFEVISDEKNRSQTESQTSAVSVYDIFGLEETIVPYSLTIIDTPGFGHTEGIEKDEMILKLLQDLFCIPEGVDTVTAVGLVMNSSLSRMDERMAYIFNSVTSLFGKDMEQNIVPIMTFSDGGEPRNAIKALEDAEIKFTKNEKNEPVYFLFNNRQKEMIGNEKHEKTAHFAFETSEDGMREFTNFLGNTKPQSLKTTVEVIKERIRLTACIQNLKERVAEVEMKQETIRKNSEELSRFKQEMEKNQNFTVNIEEIYKSKEEINTKWDNKAVTCNICKENCHHPGCTIAWSPKWCEVIKKGKCTSCSGKCPVDAHVKEKWKYVTKTKTVKMTIEEIKAKYDKNKAESEKKTSLLQDLEKEISDLEQYRKQCLDEVFHILEQLEKIALNVDSVSTFLHLEFLDKKMVTGDTRKIQILEQMRSRMNKINQAAAKYFRFFKGHQSKK